MAKIIKVLNHNALIVHDAQSSRALLLLGKGIGFGRRINEQLEIGKAEGCSVYELQQKTSKGETRDVLRSMDPLYLEISAEIVELAEREFGEIDRNILVPLADHIAFALTRIRSKMNITNPFSNDIRLLQHLKEVEEPFEKHQIGSSAMAYKRNPMRSERIDSLSRYIIADALNPAITAATQWFERTLDDSANKRISVAEGFLAADAVLSLVINVVDGLVVNTAVIDRNLRRELPFMATENIMMDCVKRGGDRQELHEAIRVHSMEAARRVKQGDGQNDLLERIAADPAFGVTLEELQQVLEPSRYVGCAPMQAEAFVKEQIEPVTAKYAGDLGMQVSINV